MYTTANFPRFLPFLSHLNLLLLLHPLRSFTLIHFTPISICFKRFSFFLYRYLYILSLVSFWFLPTFIHNLRSSFVPPTHNTESRFHLTFAQHIKTHCTNTHTHTLLHSSSVRNTAFIPRHVNIYFIKLFSIALSSFIVKVVREKDRMIEVRSGGGEEGMVRILQCPLQVYPGNRLPWQWNHGILHPVIRF